MCLVSVAINYNNYRPSLSPEMNKSHREALTGQGRQSLRGQGRGALAGSRGSAPCRTPQSPKSPSEKSAGREAKQSGGLFWRGKPSPGFPDWRAKHVNDCTNFPNKANYKTAIKSLRPKKSNSREKPTFSRLFLCLILPHKLPIFPDILRHNSHIVIRQHPSARLRLAQPVGGLIAFRRFNRRKLYLRIA